MIFVLRAAAGTGSCEAGTSGLGRFSATSILRRGLAKPPLRTIRAIVNEASLTTRTSSIFFLRTKKLRASSEPWRAFRIDVGGSVANTTRSR